MTFENRKKRYEFYLENKDAARAKELSEKYPDVKPKVEEPKKQKSKKE